MIGPATILISIAISLALTFIFVSLRLIWSAVVAGRTQRYLILTVSIIGLVGIVVALSLCVIVWFGYGVAHTGKDATTDIIVLISTVPPFFLVSFGLWFLAGRLLTQLRPDVTPPEDSIKR